MKGKNSSFPYFKIIIAVCVAFWFVFITFLSINILERKYAYPLRYVDEIERISKDYDVNKALILSVIKTESGFNEKATSNKGAVGLMQITPKTAEYIANNLCIINYDIYYPETNIEFGTYYLRYLSDRFTGLNEILSAYNAGEGTVRKWLLNSEFSDDGVTLKKIPYPETDNYVKKILKTLQRYKKLYGKLLDK